MTTVEDTACTRVAKDIWCTSRDMEKSIAVTAKITRVRVTKRVALIGINQSSQNSNSEKFRIVIWRNAGGEKNCTGRKCDSLLPVLKNQVKLRKQILSSVLKISCFVNTGFNPG